MEYLRACYRERTSVVVSSRFPPSLQPSDLVFDLNAVLKGRAARKRQIQLLQPWSSGLPAPRNEFDRLRR